MTNEPKMAPQAPASAAANQSDKSAEKSTTETKPIVTPAPVATPPDAKKI